MNDKITVDDSKPAPVGISGWLILPAIGLILAPILYLINIALLIRLLPQFSDMGQRSLVIVNTAGIAVLLILTVATAIKFFGRKSTAPAAVIRLMIIQLLLLLILIVVSTATGPDLLLKDYYRGFVRSLMFSIIWILYFKESKRVKATFTK